MRAYVDEHLTPLPLFPGAALSSSSGPWGNFECPTTGHEFYYVAGRDDQPSLLWRYPMVTARQLEDPAFVARAADDWAAALASPDPYRTFLAHHTMYSRAWERYLVELRLGACSPEAAIVFLEVDPWCLWSGYVKQKVMRYVSRIDHCRADRRRLQEVVVAVTQKGPRREFCETALLAKRVWDREFGHELRQLAETVPETRAAVDRLFKKRFTR